MQTYAAKPRFMGIFFSPFFLFPIRPQGQSRPWTAQGSTLPSSAQPYSCSSQDHSHCGGHDERPSRKFTVLLHTVSIMDHRHTRRVSHCQYRSEGISSPTTTSKHFGNPFCHSACTSQTTLLAIWTACAEHDPSDYKNFLKVVRRLGLNGVVNPVWIDWLLSEPCEFITPEALHHFYQVFWDHDVKWSIAVTGVTKLNFCFSLLQTPVRYRAFEDGISKLKQVTGHDHCTIQCYIVGIIAGSVP